MGNFTGSRVGRANLAIGAAETVLIWVDEPGTPPSQWSLIIDDPSGGSLVFWDMGHDQVSFASPTAGIALVAGHNIIEHQVFGSSVTVRIQAATASTFKAMLVRVHK